MSYEYTNSEPNPGLDSQIVVPSSRYQTWKIIRLSLIRWVRGYNAGARPQQINKILNKSSK
jgi:hypothetical protein